MYKVIIADDNRMELDTVKELVKNCGLEVYVEKTFRDGMSAADYALNNPVDILITDIQMPEMNGIDLIEYLQNHNIMCEVILITCYDDNKHMRKAIEFGVDAYVLKPIIKEEFDKAMEKAVKKCIDKSVSTSFASFVVKNISELRSNFLKDLLLNDKHEKRVTVDNEDVLGVKIAGKYIGVVLVRTDSQKNVIADFIRNMDKISVYETNLTNSEIALVITSDKFIDAEELTRKLSCTCTDSGHDLRAGVSRIYYNVQNLNTTLEESRFALLAAESFNIGKIVSYEEVSFTNPSLNIPFDSEQLKNLLSEILLKKDISSIETFLNEYLTVKKLNSRNSLRVFVYTVMNMMFSLLSEIDVSMEKMLNGEELFKKINTIESILDLKQWLYDILITAIKSVETSANPHKTLVKAACDYIHTNYRGKLTLDEIAAKVGISKRQLHRIFLKEKQISVLDYVTNYRMEQAKHMLRKRNSKIYVVANSVGYKSKVHFCSIFKEIVGVSPSEYKSGIKD